MDSTVGILPHAHPRPYSSPTNSSPIADHRDASSQRYAFLNHSTATVNQNLPPNVDDKPLARQRRRRTSPEDQTILEAAYIRDPKPDKAARLQIVEQVSLGEKEVQIWFQNRRQTSRRKSRPLLPHEIAQYQLSRNGVAPYPSSYPTVISSPEAGVHAPADASTELENRVEMQESLSKQLDASSDLQRLPSSESSVDGASQEDGDLQLPSLTRNDAITAPSTRTLDVSIGQLERIDSPETARPLRRSQSVSQPSFQMQANTANLKARLKKSSSCVRLSLSSEGNAEVIVKESPSPSPPHASQDPPLGPMGSGSLPSATSTNPAPILTPMKLPQRRSSGRSRDSRVWEFWCDKDSRSELEEKAEQDASGSAAGAIGLLRSASGRSVLGAIPSKRNSTLSRQSITLKRSKVETTIPRLSKSSTALGRLEGMLPSKAVTYARQTTKVKSIEPPYSVYIPGNESDKENWSPSTDMLPEGNLQHSLPPLSKQVARHYSAHELKQPKGSFSTEDPEVAAFMRGTRKKSGVSGDEELDCVQGLLSLSQGNWGR